MNHQQKNREEQKELRSGPTTLGGIGNYYERQLLNQKHLEEVQDTRAQRVADII